MYQASSQRASGSCTRLLFDYFGPAETKKRRHGGKTAAVHAGSAQEQNFFDLKLQMRPEDTENIYIYKCVQVSQTGPTYVISESLERDVINVLCCVVAQLNFLKMLTYVSEYRQFVVII